MEGQSTVTIRGYRCEDEAALIALWNAALPLDLVDARTFRRKVLLDPNFARDWLLVAEAEGELVGFCLCLIRRVPHDGVGLEPTRGWITAFGVHPDRRRRGIGAALLEAAFELLPVAGREEILIAPHTPNYFVPGVDEVAYAEGLCFLLKRGFEVISRPLSMDASIVLLDYAPYAERKARLAAAGVEVRHLRPNEAPALIEFLRDHVNPDWARHARELLTDATKGLADCDQFVIALSGGEIVGYCQFEGEHFGPFGVRDDMQGRGIGTVLLADCLQTMRTRGLHNAWVLWTSDEAAQKVYARFGFHETRRFSVLRKRL